MIQGFKEIVNCLVEFKYLSLEYCDIIPTQFIYTQNLFPCEVWSNYYYDTHEGFSRYADLKTVRLIRD